MGSRKPSFRYDPKAESESGESDPSTGKRIIPRHNPSMLGALAFLIGVWVGMPLVAAYLEIREKIADFQALRKS